MAAIMEVRLSLAALQRILPLSIAPIRSISTFTRFSVKAASGESVVHALLFD
jgi:hypothetical protein